MSPTAPAEAPTAPTPSPLEPLAPLDARPLFPGERAALLELLSDLPPEQWTLPTVCPGWSVKDVAAHLLADDLGRLSGGRDGFANPDFATGLDVATWAGLVAAIDRQNDLWVRAMRRLSPGVLVDLLRFTAEPTAAYFAALDLAAVGRPVDWAGPDPAPVWLDLAREYTERWVHQQQICDAVRRPGLTGREWLHPVLDAFARALPHALHEVAAPPGSRVALEVLGEAGGVWLAERGATGWSLGRGETTGAWAGVSLDQDLAWRLFTRGVAPEVAAERVAVTGDPEAVCRVLRMVAILAP
jgi:uncharacterized protein (TIGR03083 family)